MPPTGVGPEQGPLLLEAFWKHLTDRVHHMTVRLTVPTEAWTGTCISQNSKSKSKSKSHMPSRATISLLEPIDKSTLQVTLESCQRAAPSRRRHWNPNSDSRRPAHPFLKSSARIGSVSRYHGTNVAQALDSKDSTSSDRMPSFGRPLVALEPPVNSGEYALSRKL